MDTKEKNREAASQRRPRQVRQEEPAERRPRERTAPRQEQTGRPRQTAVREPGKQPAKPKQPAQQSRRAAGTAQTQEQPRKKTASAAARQPSRQAPVREMPQQSQRRTQKPEDARRSAPQGMGPRKSAPRATAQEPVKQGSQERTRRTRQKKKQNPLQKVLGAIGSKEQEKNPDRLEAALARQEQRKAKAAQKKKRAQRYDTPAVIYTQPAAFNRNRLFVQLLTVTAVVVALVMGLSVFFKVENITVSGAETYSPWSVREASGIQEGDNLLTFSKARASAQIRANLSYVDRVRIGIKLPDTVTIYIEELDVAYAIKSGEGTWWLMTSSGRMVQQIDTATASSYTQVLGVTVDKPQVNEDAVATENVPTETGADGEIIPVTVTGAQRLHAALQILEALEANDIVGEAASVDVTRLEDVILWYGTQYQVNLGDTGNMDFKIACMNDAILQMSDYQSGVLDISFTTFDDQVGFTPFA